MTGTVTPKWVAPLVPKYPTPKQNEKKDKDYTLWILGKAKYTESQIIQ